MSLINLEKISEPANTLIKKISDAIGGIFEPWQIKRIAKAQAEATLIKAKSDIEIKDLHQRSMYRFFEEEAKQQENMESIINKALPLLEDGTDPSKMDNDWITNFFDKSRIISDNEMQTLWSRILAGEANMQGTYSKITVNFLNDLDKVDAELFENFSNFSWLIGNLTPLIFNLNNNVYAAQGINFAALVHLDDIGLIRFDSLSGFNKVGFPKNLKVSYCGNPLNLKFNKDKDNALNVGKVMFTQIGAELVTICKIQEVKGFYDYVKHQWKKYLD